MIEGKCFGVPLRLRFEAAAMREVCAVLPPGFSPVCLEGTPSQEFSIEPAGSLYTARRGRRRICAARPLPEVLHALRKSIQLWVAEHAPDHVFIHAGVVVWNGNAILFPGASFAGKSTLVWSMVQAGATYFSDEFAVLDREGFATAFPVPLALRREGNLRHTPSVFSAPTGARSRAELLVFAAFQPGSRWEPGRLSPGLATLHLLSNAVAARTYPHRVLAAISRLAARVPAYAGARGEADAVKEWIEEVSGLRAGQIPPAAGLPESMIFSGGNRWV